HQDREGDYVLELEVKAEDNRPQRLDEAQEQAAEHCAGDVADAAQDGGGEGLQPGYEAHVVIDDAVVDAPHHAGCTGHRTADGERLRDHPVDVDTHQGCRPLILGDCAHGAAQARPLYDNV